MKPPPTRNGTGRFSLNRPVFSFTGPRATSRSRTEFIQRIERMLDRYPPHFFKSGLSCQRSHLRLRQSGCAETFAAFGQADVHAIEETEGIEDGTDRPEVVLDRFTAQRVRASRKCRPDSGRDGLRVAIRAAGSVASWTTSNEVMTSNRSGNPVDTSWRFDPDAVGETGGLDAGGRLRVRPGPGSCRSQQKREFGKASASRISARPLPQPTSATETPCSRRRCKSGIAGIHSCTSR